MPFRNRLLLCRRRFADQNIDCFVTFHPIHIRYLTGFTGSNGVLFVDAEAATLITDSRYDGQAQAETHDISVLISERGKSVSEAMIGSGLIRAGARIGFEASHVSVQLLEKLQGQMRDATWSPTRALVESIRRQKSPAEIEFIKEAISITERVFEQILPTIRPGVSERQLALDIDHRIRLEGAERNSFETIAAFGERSALPHAHPTERVLQKNECVLLDFGAVVHGYHADMTRTLFVGKPDAQFDYAYQALLKAHELAVKSARAGLACRELDGMARDELVRSDLSSYFVHSLGHGIGLEIHEGPTIGTTSEERLSAGDVITIEPGVYFPGRFGIRIENDILITDDGSVDLMKMSTNLIVLEA